MTLPTAADVTQARARLEGVARATPVFRSSTFSSLAGRDVWLKAENLQRTGSFKVRGAVNRVAVLTDEERTRGVVAASAGNHGQAVAWAAREAGVPATIFVPQDAPMAKVEATRSYGADVELVGEGFEQAVQAGRAHADSTGATYIHAFEEPAVVAGQGTIGLELAEQLNGVETIVVPVGGGGLAAGIALAMPGARVVGVRTGPEGYAIADGIAVKEEDPELELRRGHEGRDRLSRRGPRRRGRRARSAYPKLRCAGFRTTRPPFGPILSAEEMPHVFNPERGWVATANNRQWPSSSRFYPGDGQSPRSGRSASRSFF